MKRGTTYPITLTVPGVNLEEADWVIVSMKSDGSTEMEFTGAQLGISWDGEKSTVVFGLTQAQSLALLPRAKIDCNWFMYGVRGGAEPAVISVTETLLKRVVE